MKTALSCAILQIATISALAPMSFAADTSLIDAAKKDGSVTWYTTQVVDQLARPAATAFTRKYGIDVNLVRADSSTLVLRVLNEAAAGQVQADVIDYTMGSLALKQRGIVLRWLPPAAFYLPKHLVDPDGYWMAGSANVLTIGYNTNLVQNGEQPKSFEDLLNKKWDGKLVWGSTNSPSAAPGFIGTALASMGVDAGMNYLRKLSEQHITSLQQSAREVINQVISGEYPVALQIFNNHAEISAKKGAPVNWTPLQASMAHLLVFSVTAAAPHPNAGKLFEDFMTSKDGQTIFRNADYLTVDPAIPPRDASLALDEKNFHAIYFTPEQLESSMPKWFDIYQTLFR